MHYTSEHWPGIIFTPRIYLNGDLLTLHGATFPVDRLTLDNFYSF